MASRLHVQCKYSPGTCFVLTGYLQGIYMVFSTSANGKLASVRCSSKEVDGRQHHNSEASRLVRRRGHLRSQKRTKDERRRLWWLKWGRVLAGKNVKPSQTAPIPLQRDIGGPLIESSKCQHYLAVLEYCLSRRPSSLLLRTRHIVEGIPVLSSCRLGRENILTSMLLPPCCRTTCSPSDPVRRVPRPDARPLI